MDKQETLLEIHKMVSEELRHTSNVVWRFSVAIATLQCAALALSVQKDAHEVLGALALLIGFLLSFLFSLMLVRQGRERKGFADRMKVVEKQLREFNEEIFQPIESTLHCYTSVVMARWLAGESFVGLFIAVVLFVRACTLAF